MDSDPAAIPSSDDRHNIKVKVASTLKWTVIDKVSVQLLYAVTGIVLALKLSQADFGLVGAVLVFQAFGSLFVDSGFASALIQRKAPTRDDYSTVLWFNISMAVGLYVVLYFCAPLIADWYGGDERIIPLSRVMFLTFIINATSIVQVNRLNKMMEMKMVTVANTGGLIAGSIAGIAMAMAGFGAWAIVGQSLLLSSVKSAILWLSSSWRPSAVFSLKILKSFFKVGCGVMVTSFFNILYLNIYSFLIGNRVGMTGLGYYSQADKWSKMGVSSLSAVITSSFLPVLSKYQDDPVHYAAVTSKFARLTAYITFPSLGILAALAPALFHMLFGTKWDGSIQLFQLLLLQGMCVVISGLYSNFILARGKAKLLVVSESVRYVVALIAIVATLPYLSLSSAADVTEGIKIFLYGQIAASCAFWCVMTILAARVSHRRWWTLPLDLSPYLAQSLVIVLGIVSLYNLSLPSWAIILIGTIGGGAIYLGINMVLHSRIQADAIAYLRHKL